MNRTPPKPARVAAPAKTVRKVDQVLVSEYGFAVLVKLPINGTLMEKKIYSRSGLAVFSRNPLTLGRGGSQRNTNYGVPYEDRRYSGHITDCDSDTIHVINNNLAQAYGFAPLKSMYSKTMGGSFMSNSCPHCGVLMGNFFTEQAFIEARYHNRVIQTDSIHISRAPVIVHGKEIEADFERGEWVLLNALPKKSQITVNTDNHNAGT